MDFGDDICANLIEFKHICPNDNGEYLIPVTSLKEEMTRFTLTTQCYGNDIIGGMLPNSLTNLTITNQKVFAYGSMSSISHLVNNEKYHPVLAETFINEDKTKVGRINLYLTTNELVEFGPHSFEESNSFETIKMPNSVKKISEYAFSNMDSLESVVFSTNSELTTIGAYAFADCDKITSFTIPDNISVIDEAAFYHCDSLQSFDFNKVIEIGDNAFEECASLKTINLRNVSSIGAYAFAHNDALYNDCEDVLTIPASVEAIGAYAFAYSNGLKDFRLLNKLIGEYMFYNCLGFESVTIPANIEAIGAYAFADCTNISGKNNSEGTSDAKLAVSFENKLIGSHMFDGCVGITSLVISSTIEEIRDYAFANCTRLADIEFNNKLIGEYMFFNDTALEAVIVPENIQEIRIGAFENCSNLANLTLPFVGKERANNNSEEALFGYIFGSKRETTDQAKMQFFAKTDDPYYDDLIERATSEDENYEFEAKIPASLKNVTITNETIVGYGAFSNASDINTITFANNKDGNSTLVAIDNYAFYNCSGLESITIPNSVQTIGYAAFMGCDNLKSIILPFVGQLRNNASTADITRNATSVKTGERAFFGWIFGRKITSASLRSLSSSALSYNVPESLKTIQITDELVISDQAFRDITTIDEVILNEGIITIGEEAFMNTGIKQITIPASVGLESEKAVLTETRDSKQYGYIGARAFMNASSLNTVSFTPESHVYEIKDSVFENAISLVMTSLPNSVSY